MSISWGFLAGVLLFPARSKRALKVEPEFDWNEELEWLELERQKRKLKDVPCETSSETEAVEVDVKLVKLQPESRSKRDESIKWIKEFHKVSGELPTWTETRTTLKLSAASASRYRAQAALELGIQPEKKAA